MIAEFLHFYDDCPSARDYDALVYDPADVTCWVCLDEMHVAGLLPAEEYE